jgi:hypothetical protein
MCKINIYIAIMLHFINFWQSTGQTAVTGHPRWTNCIEHQTNSMQRKQQTGSNTPPDGRHALAVFDVAYPHETTSCRDEVVKRFVKSRTDSVLSGRASCSFEEITHVR